MKGFRDLLRISVEDFNFLLEKVAPHITKKDTHLRKAISPKDRLSVTLRFLATGECAHKSNPNLRPPFSVGLGTTRNVDVTYLLYLPISLSIPLYLSVSQVKPSIH